MSRITNFFDKRIIFRVFSIIALMALLAGQLVPQTEVHAASPLTVTPITWNVVGLDSNNVNIGPNNFPVGVRACNPASNTVTFSDIEADFVWLTGGTQSNDSYIRLRNGSLDPIRPDPQVNLAPNSCHDFYFEIQVERDSVSYDETRRYRIDVTYDDPDFFGVETVSTPTPREIYVERLISQSRNSTTNVWLNGNPIAAGGSMTLIVGNTYNIQLDGSTATNGYEQIESFINFPNTIFRINSVTTSYSANDTGTPDPNAASKLYADGCTWVNDPTSPVYRTCTETGKYGGNVTVIYNVTIIGGGGTSQTLTNLIYDFSGSSYHYNADFAGQFRIANIVSPANITKSFNPNTIPANQISTLTYIINNISSGSLSNINFADTTGWPSGVTVDSSTVAYGGSCGSPTATMTVGSPGASFSNITIAGNSTCTIAITVRSTVDGTYPNSTNNLYIGALDTGSKAAATLVVSSTPSLTGYTCTAGEKTTLVSWNFDVADGGTVTNPNFTASTKASDVSAASTVATASAGSGTALLDNVVGGANAWRILGGWHVIQSTPTHSSIPFFEFKVDSSNYTEVEIRLSYRMDNTTGPGWGNPGDNQIYVHTSNDNGVNWIDMPATGFIATKGNTWHPYTPVPPGVNHVASGSATGISTTTFRINARGSSASATTEYLALDNVTFVGCRRPTSSNTFQGFFTHYHRFGYVGSPG